MMRSRWSVRDAKAKLSTVVGRALWGSPQPIFKDGKRVAVVLSAAEYDRLRAAKALKDRQSSAKPP